MNRIVNIVVIAVVTVVIVVGERGGGGGGGKKSDGDDDRSMSRFDAVNLYLLNCPLINYHQSRI